MTKRVKTIYLWNIVSGKITETMHKEWVKELSIVKKEVVDWFHVKELV